MLTIISGGQTGVDQAALAVATDLGFPTGGTAPLGYRTDDGPMPELLRDVYGLQECAFYGYRPRTILNVLRADLTVWFGDPGSPWGWLTIGTAQQQHKPLLINPTVDVLLHRIGSLHVQILNVAGNRKRTNPGASAQATLILGAVLSALRDGEAQQTS